MTSTTYVVDSDGQFSNVNVDFRLHFGLHFW